MSSSQTVVAQRGYLANILTIPPLIYPFQYNPTQLTDTKQVTWGKRDPIPPMDSALGGAASVTAGAGGISGSLGGIASGLETGIESLGRTFSKADFHKFDSEGDRTLSFQIQIDGREQRPGEPGRRRTEEGDILTDLAILRSFVYPRLGELLDIFQAAFSNNSDSYVKNWFNEPPTALLILGDLAVEGFVTNLQITETLFNADLNPLRADVNITMIEKTDSLSFITDSVKRLGRTLYGTAIEDIGNVLF